MKKKRSEVEKTEKNILICDECGAKLPLDAKFCKKCGKIFKSSELVSDSEWKTLQIKQSEQENYIKSEEENKTGKKNAPVFISDNSLSSKLYKLKPIERICPSCNTIIQSRVLLQCPICYEKLPPLPEVYMKEITKQFSTRYAIEREKPQVIERKLKEDKWNINESINVLFISLFLYVLIQFFILSILYRSNPEYWQNPEQIKLTIQILYIDNLSKLIFLIFPIYYIKKNKHKFSKLGFFKIEKPIKLYINSIVFGIILYITTYILEIILSALANIGISVLAVPEFYNEETNLIKNLPISLFLIYIIFMIIGIISEEFVFRGVLHRGLIDAYESKGKKKSKSFIILMVSLIYSICFFILSINLYIFIINFVLSIIIGILFELESANIKSIFLALTIYGIISGISIIL